MNSRNPNPTTHHMASITHLPCVVNNPGLMEAWQLAVMSIQLPVATGEWVILQAAFPLTERKWSQMLAVLNAMKPAIVIEDT